MIFLMSACTTTMEKTDPDMTVEPLITDDDQVIVIPPAEKKRYISTPVVQRILFKSKNKFENKEFDAAVNYLERGINIAPNNPKLWNMLAAIRLEQGNYKQAKQLAKKSNVLVEGDDELRAFNRQIIDRADWLLEH